MSIKYGGEPKVYFQNPNGEYERVDIDNVECIENIANANYPFIQRSFDSSFTISGKKATEAFNKLGEAIKKQQKKMYENFKNAIANVNSNKAETITIEKMHSVYEMMRKVHETGERIGNHKDAPQSVTVRCDIKVIPACLIDEIKWVQFRFPRSKKKRIREKWRKNQSNWRHDITPNYYLVKPDISEHPILLMSENGKAALLKEGNKHLK